MLRGDLKYVVNILLSFQKTVKGAAYYVKQIRSLDVRHQDFAATSPQNPFHNARLSINTIIERVP